MAQPDTHNNLFDNGTTLELSVVQFGDGKYGPTVGNSAIPEKFGFFEIGTFYSLKSWVQGDLHAGWPSTTERCSLNAVLGYYDDQLVKAIPTIKSDGKLAYKKLMSLEEEALKLAFIDHRIECVHKDKIKKDGGTFKDYIKKSNRLQKGERRIGGREYPAFHISRTKEAGVPELWRWNHQTSTFMIDDNFQFDDKPPHPHPNNFLTPKSIIVPRMQIIFYTNEDRYGIKLLLDKYIRIIRPGRDEQVYGANVYLPIPIEMRDSYYLNTPMSQEPSSSKSSTDSSSKSSSKRRRLED